MNRKSMPIKILLAAASIGLTSASALAQNALGDGRGLEKPMRQGGGGNTPRADFAAEVRFRNSLVTGTAAGGRGLRIDRPYDEVGEVEARLGSDDLFAFRRDSLYSGLAGQGFRGTEGLQYQIGLTTGGRFTVSRDQAGAAGTVGGLQNQALSQNRTRTQSWAVQNAPTGTLRSTAAFSATQGLRPVMLDARTTDEGEREVTASSSLLGVRTIKQGKIGELEALKYADVDAARAAAKEAAAKKQPLAADAGLRAKSASEAEETSAVRTAFSDLRVKLGRFGEVEKPAEEAGKEPRPDQRGGERGSKETPAKDGSKPQGPKDEKGDRTPTRGATPSTATPDVTMPQDGEKDAGKEKKASAWEQRMADLKASLRSPDRKLKEAEKSKRELDKETLAAIREAGKEPTRTLIPQAPEWRDLFVEQVRAGEKAMGEEKYFDAEERFSRALALKPGSVDAQVGRINAQLAAGLLTSASMNLRQLVTQNPEVAGMRFAGNLMPGPERQAKLLAQLRDNIAGPGRDTLRVPRESSLLLAYLGYQRGDEAAVKDGLAMLRDQCRFEDTKWIDFLEGVWAAPEGAGKK